MSVDLVDKKDARLFGFTFHSVPADLRQKEFRTGDILLSSPVDTDTLQPGDIITFQSINPQHYGEVITHTIRDRVVYEGEPAFITYSSGGETEENDPYPVPADKVIGKYQFRLPGLGYFFQYLETTAGYITLIFLPYLVLILLIGTRYILFIRRRWYKRREAFASEEEVRMRRIGKSVCGRKRCGTSSGSSRRSWTRRRPNAGTKDNRKPFRDNRNGFFIAIINFSRDTFRDESVQSAAFRRRRRPRFRGLPS